MLTISEHSSIIKEEWSAQFYQTLLPALGIASLIMRDYEGQIKAWGDTVHIPTVASPGRATVQTSDNEAYDVQQFAPSNLDLVIDKRATYAFDVTDWARYQSNPAYQAEYRRIAAHEIARAVDDKILSTFSAGSSASGVSAMTREYFAQAKRVFDAAYVPLADRFAIVDPYYFEDLLTTEVELLDKNYNDGSTPLLSGQFKSPIYGFTTIMSPLLSQNVAWFFHKDAMALGIQRDAEYKEIDLEAKLNVPAMRVRVNNLFGLKQMDSDMVYKIYNS